ncbi:diguanylate cyclase/phosphodiesterase [Tepidicaulis marinus]|uniref:Diguanylate cyclase/phosphodiesterase n=1 Tax=Tepidicaulis marinus TaxID=1333998 RepID=A0A081BDU5_9HYPH|nr:EAL domain-containing protein [Tepidicaulis marinus]GAK46213.1 diguanylate cyclase/phosphodiesterase [Tepidicaulis marinus]
MTGAGHTRRDGRLFSLRWKILAPLAVLGICAVTALLVAAAFMLSAHGRSELRREAETIADSIANAAESIEDGGQFARFVTAFGSRQNVNTIAVLDAASGKIVAATRLSWVGQSIQDVAAPVLFKRIAEVQAAGKRHDGLWQEDSAATYVSYRPMLHFGSTGDETMSDGVIVIRLSADGILGDMRQSGWRFAGAAILVLVGLLGVLAFLIYELVLMPLAHLERFAQFRDKSAASFKRLLGKRDEFGALAHVMAQSFGEAEESSHRLAELAMNDELTGLGNRTHFRTRLRDTIGASGTGDTRLALVLVDVDSFKSINDTYGHDVGDALLCSVADILRAHAREGEVLARLGGDEFALLLKEEGSADDVLARVQGLLDALSRPMSLGGNIVHGGSSAGITLFPQDGRDAEVLMKNADLALNMAKSEGHNSLQFFRHELKLRALERSSIERDLQRAIEQHEFELHFQPKIDLAKGTVAGSEALLRWRHPERGFVPPWAFIPVAEHSGFVCELTHWVINEACRQIKAWREAGLPPISVAVNVSAADLVNGDLSDFVANTLVTHGVSPRQLEIEVTESMVMHDVETVIATLRRLRSMGIAISIDDFGTGYSSLAYLKRFPVKCLKIDRSFVDDLDRTSDGQAIPKLIVDLARSLGVKVVAEGVETVRQAERLIDMGCDEAQGYYFGRPMPAEDFSAYVMQAPENLKKLMPARSDAAERLRKILQEGVA